MNRLATLLSRLVWLSLLPLLLLACGLAAFYVHSGQLATQEAAARRLGNYAAQIDGFLETRILALSMLANSPLADDPKRWPDLYAEAQAFHASFGSHVVFADAQRQMIFNTRVPFGTALPRVPDAGKGRSGALVALETGKPAVGDIVQGPVIDQPLVGIVVPGLRAGRVRHLMVVTTTTGELQRRVDAFPLAPGWALTVQDSAGDLIARQAPAGFDPARDVDPDWHFAAKSRFARWNITVEVPRTVTRQPVLDSMAALLLAIVLTTVAGRVLGRRVARRIERQIAGLGHPGPDTPPADIVEISAVRERLDAQLTSLRDSETRRETEMTAALEAQHQGRLAALNLVDDAVAARARADAALAGLKESQAHLARLNRLYLTLSQSNQAIVHCDSEGALFPQICREAVSFGGLKMAWIGLVDATGKTVTPVASFGDAADYLADALILMAAESPRSLGPTASAIRENQPVWCQDFLHDLRTAPWHEHGARAGWMASAALPLCRKGVAVGALSLYAGEVNFFDDAIQKLLIEMAADVSFAMDSYASAIERNRAQAEMAERLDELHRWQQVMLGREGRVMAMKKEVNSLLAAHGQAPRYPNAVDEGPDK